MITAIILRSITVDKIAEKQSEEVHFC